MKNFLIRLVSFFSLFAVLLAAILYWHRTSVYSSDNYMLAFGPKHDRAAELVSPKIFLVGGSNNAFGWDSQRIQEKTGKPVVNMGYYAGQGIPYRLREVDPYVEAGDIIVLSIEYQILHGHRNPTLPFLSAYTDPDSFRFFGWDTWKRFLDRGALLGLRGVLHETVDALGGAVPTFEHPYRRDSFDAYGDVVAHREMSPRDRPAFSEDIIDEDWEALDRSIRLIERFAERWRASGAEVYFWLPSLPDGVFRASRADLRRTAERLADAPTVPLLNELEAVETPDALFFDSYYHLNAEGIRQRTDRLIEALKSETPLP